jgi:hypothetical protein
MKLSEIVQTGLSENREMTTNLRSSRRASSRNATALT